MVKACRQDHALLIGLFAITISRNGGMVQQVSFYNWIQSFECPPLPEPQPPGCFDNKTGQNLWQRQNLIANLCAIPQVILAGKLSDKVSAKKLIPAGIIYQILVFTAYCFVEHPQDSLAYVLAVFQVGTQMIMIVSMQSYIAKRCPKNIRGMIFAVIGICCALGCVGYLQVYGLLSRHFGS